MSARPSASNASTADATSSPATRAATVPFATDSARASAVHAGGSASSRRATDSTTERGVPAITAWT